MIQQGPQVVNPTVLRAQIADAQANLVGLQEEFARLQGQSQAGPGGSLVALKASKLSMDVAEAQGRLARLNALAKMQGMSVGGSGTAQLPPRPRFGDRIDPEMVIGMSFVILLAFVIPLSIGLMRRMMRAPAPRLDENALGGASRLDRLEHAVDSIAIEVERISEGQRFVTKLLADQSAKSAIESGK